MTLRGNIYLVLVQRLLLAMLLYTICRIGFYLFNYAYFPDITLTGFLKILYGGLMFDLTAVLYVNALFIVLMILPIDLRFTTGYQRVVKVIFFFFNGIAIATNVADFIYYRFTLRRTTADIFSQFENEQNLGALSIRFLFDYWYAVLFWIALVWLMVAFYQRTRVTGPMIKNRLAYYGFGVLSLPIIIYLFIGGVRGGFRHSTRPITLSNAGEFVQQANEVSIVLNTPFAIFRTLGKTKIRKVNYFDEQEVEAIYSPVHRPADTTKFKSFNVVIIILESFSKEFIGSLNAEKPGYTGYTPFLDSLLQHSRTFAYSFANGRKSIDGLPSIIAGIPSVDIPYVLTPFSNNKIRALGTLLKEKGYHTSFFHGAPNGSMGFNSFMNLAGFDHYYGMSEYGNDADFDSMWGIWDHRFMPFYAEKLNSFPQPFISTFFSVSSHHPFKIPVEFEGEFKGGAQPILKCIQYTDYALRNFFQTVRRMPWYENTLFVITADHCSSDIIFPESRTIWGLHSVPVIFFRPDNSLTGVENSLVQHIDIMPTVLGYLGYEKPYVAFGRDVFSQSEPFAFVYRDTYNLFSENYLLCFDGEKTTALYDFKADKMLSADLKEQQPLIVSQMEVKLKGIIQQYKNRMVDNRLTVQ
ncbi:MAG: sulfatase-like hydrolase/transferase [Flammeovirgaceae bacterium]|nr:MAG: sulfatase-like hydrolase/transferase [Flammeovirgaceae bacterium]